MNIANTIEVSTFPNSRPFFYKNKTLNRPQFYYRSTSATRYAVKLFIFAVQQFCGLISIFGFHRLCAGPFVIPYVPHSCVHVRLRSASCAHIDISDHLWRNRFRTARLLNFTGVCLALQFTNFTLFYLDLFKAIGGGLWSKNHFDRSR